MKSLYDIIDIMKSYMKSWYDILGIHCLQVDLQDFPAPYLYQEDKEGGP